MKFMIEFRLGRLFLRLIILGIIISPNLASAQFFTTIGYGDELAGFRKTGQFAGNYELVVNIGNITNLLTTAPGAQVDISNYSPAQLSDAFPDGFGNLQWSVFASFQNPDPWTNNLGVFPPNSCWYTFARTNVDVQSTPPKRQSYVSQGSLKNKMLGVAQGASSISVGLAVTNADNNSVLVREPVTATEYILTTFIGDISDPTFGNFGGSTLNFSVENTTPTGFPAIARSDLYQSCPASSRTYGPYVDPITGLTNGATYFVGYFTLDPSGTMTFTRASTNSVVPPPPPPQLSVGNSGTTITISFATTNGATYTLYYTNVAGLSAPVSSWASLGTLVGDGTTKSFTDAISDAVRFYRVGAH
jgi:hypothetical protein